MFQACVVSRQFRGINCEDRSCFPTLAAMTPEQSSAPILFKEHTAAQLHERLAHLDVSERLARRLQAAVVREDAAAVPASMNEVPRRLLERVAEATVIPRLTLLDRVTSPRDGFTKY